MLFGEIECRQHISVRLPKTTGKVPTNVVRLLSNRSPRRQRRQIDSHYSSTSVRCETSMVPFTPIEKKDRYTLRLVQPHPVAVTQYSSRGDGYLALGAYMSGGNDCSEKFPETHPIIMTYRKTTNGYRKTMQVYLDGSSRTPPLPKTQSVYLDIAGGEVIAARKFEGNATQEACERTLKELLHALEQDGLGAASSFKTSGDAMDDASGSVDFQLAQYGPLHSLSPRLNEIWVKVKM